MIRCSSILLRFPNLSQLYNSAAQALSSQHIQVCCLGLVGYMLLVVRFVGWLADSKVEIIHAIRDMFKARRETI